MAADNCSCHYRMHNKLIIADNRFSIVGGRNIGNEYFGLNPKHNFIDFKKSRPEISDNAFSPAFLDYLIWMINCEKSTVIT
ncbi:MAG: hypothetical protein PVH42_08975 [Desulfobacterales bacterium]|jgi:phosphatidylserine/phosphatidylglycerophosphate/cardiolipin synthase-like enzyme